MLNIPKSTLKRVVVVGGGFGGLSLLKELRGADFQVVLIDKENNHQFQPLLYQVATSGLEPTAIAFPLRSVFRFVKNFYFRMACVERVDVQNSIVYTSHGSLYYDYLVLATGADTNYFGLQNIKNAALPLKSVGEALQLRNHIYRTMERAVRVDHESEKEACLNFVIAGGGPTGVEMAGAMAELKNSILPKDYTEIDFSKMKIYLLNAGDRLLESFSKESSMRTLIDLQKMGVDVRLGAMVSDYVDGAVVCKDGERIKTESLVWVSGIVANKIGGLEGAIGRGGRMRVDGECRVLGVDGESVGVVDNVFVVGDGAIMEGVDQKFMGGHPQVAQVAMQQGVLVGRNLIKEMKGLSGEVFKYRDKGSMATIGRNRAVAEIGGVKLGGFVAWVMWLFVHVMFIVGFRNRLLVMWDWAWSYITRDKPLRSIIYAKCNKN